MNILYYPVYAFAWLLSLIPLRGLYLLSDFICLMVYRVAGYRVALVRKHLEDCFPEKSADERKQIEKDFYHWFCDYLVETVKLLSISRKQMRRRMVFYDFHLVDEAIESGQSCALYLGHYCNWEWVSSLPLWFTPKATCGQIYHVLENKAFERLSLRLRQRMGALCIPMAETLRRLAYFRQQQKPVVIGYISDQVPFWNNIHHWCQFLNHDTPVLTGTERLVRSANHAVFYVDLHRIRRGYYEGTFRPITTEPKKMGEYEITDAYFRMLEESIRRDPACYLWTHNRWKRTREEFNLRYDEATGRVDIISSVEELRKKAAIKREERGVE